ncbi:MAG: endonuclease/exonuclease/phosphatase family protein [Bacteroidota bacterium]
MIHKIVLPVLLVALFRWWNVGPKADHSSLLINTSTAQTLPQSLHLLSLNTWGLPVRMIGHDQGKRFRNIPTALLEANPEIICLQECFSKRLRKKILTQLDSLYYITTDHLCQRKILGLLKTDCYGGLMTLSKYPVLHEEFFPFPIFQKMTFSEKSGNKGFLISVLDLGEQKLNIINTHLYSGNSALAETQRMKQAQYFNQVLDNFLLQHPYDCVLAGDLNVTHPDVPAFNAKVSKSKVYDYFIHHMGFTDPMDSIGQNDCTINPQNNRYCKSKDGQQKLDYCLYKKVGNRSNQWQLKSSIAFSGSKAISDHLGLWSELQLQTSPYPSPSVLATAPLTIETQQWPPPYFWVEQAQAEQPLRPFRTLPTPLQEASSILKHPNQHQADTK